MDTIEKLEALKNEPLPGNDPVGLITFVDEPEYHFIRDRKMLSGDDALDNHWTIAEVCSVMRLYKQSVLK